MPHTRRQHNAPLSLTNDERNQVRRCLTCLGVAWALSTMGCTGAAGPTRGISTGSNPSDASELSTRTPTAVAAETRRLEFLGGGRLPGATLDEQVDAAAREVVSLARDARLVRLRVFAPGTADLRSAQSTIVAALIAARVPLPTLNLVGVAGFPDSTQRVAVEVTRERKRVLNPNGVVFVAGLAAPTGERTVAGLKRVLSEAGTTPDAMRRISCFYESPDQVSGARTAVGAVFPNAGATFVRSYAHAASPVIECEGVAAVESATTDEVRIVTHLPGVPASPNYSIAAVVRTSRLLFTSTRFAFGAADADLTAMFTALRNDVVSQGGQMSDVVMGDNYWMTAEARDSIRVVRPRFLTGTAPAATGVFFAGLADSAAVVGTDVIVALRDVDAIHDRGT